MTPTTASRADIDGAVARAVADLEATNRMAAAGQLPLGSITVCLRRLEALRRVQDTAMAMATAQKWIARYAPVNVDEIGYEAAYVGAIRH